MRSRLAYLFLTILLIGCSKDEPTPEIKIKDKVHYGDVIIRSQSELEDFGAENNTVVVGDLLIGVQNGDDVVDLSPLSELRKVNGNLKITGTLLENLEGLTSLDSITSDLNININHQLYTLSGLEELSFVGHTVGIGDNSALSTFEGLGKLESIHTLFLAHNGNIQNLEGLKGIRHIRSYVAIAYHQLLTDYCALSEVLGSTEAWVDIFSNEYNPTKEDLASGNCKV